MQLLWIQGPLSFLNGSSLEPPGLFLELAARPNWEIKVEGPWSGKWPRTQWSLWQSSKVPLLRCKNLPEGQPSLQHYQSGLYGGVTRRKPLLSKRHMTACLEFSKRHLKTLRPSDYLAWLPSVTSGGNLSPSLRLSMVVAASCCGDVFQRQGLGD